MNALNATGWILGGCMLALVFGQAHGAESKSSTMSGGEKPAAAGATSAGNDAAKAASGKPVKHHASTHKSTRAHHEHQASTPSASSGNELAYRAALKSCVEGPAGQRDSCLDGAIMRFSRS